MSDILASLFNDREDEIRRLKAEVKFLRYVSSGYFRALGPADGDIRNSVYRNYKKSTKNPIPPGYDDPDEEE